VKKVLIIGCGNIGKLVASLASANHATVTAMARSAERLAELQQLGIVAVSGNLDDPASLENLPTKDALVFYFAPPPGGGVTDPRLRAFCAAIAAGNEPQKIVYISTSGVYGDSGGNLVTEETPATPQTARGKRRLDAEIALREWCTERRVAHVILRVTGIYGPGRLPIQQLTSGQPVLLESAAPFTNRIHAEDLARICIAAAERGESGEIFNVSDGQPGTLTQYFNAVADALALPRPRQVTLEEARKVMTPLMLSYIGESRRMDNGKMLRKLGITLLYPTLEAGIRASLKSS